jgi:proline iminopeptidase
MFKKIISLSLPVFALLFIITCQSTSLIPGEGFVQMQDAKIWYNVVGEGSKTPLLVIHGGLGVSSLYLKPLEELAKDRPVIFYDQIDCGKSSRTSDTSLWKIEHYIEEIDQIRKTLGLDKLHIYGHSWGTILAAEYMFTKPEGVESLILVGPAFNIPQYSKDKDSLLNTLPDSIGNIIKFHKRENTTDAPEYQSAMMHYYTTFFARKLPWSDELNSAFGTLNKEIFKYMKGSDSSGYLSDYDCIDKLSQIKTPTLLIAGEYDEATPTTVKYYQSLIAESKVEILENCGHLTMQDNPEEHNKIVNNFLTEVENK